MCSPSNRTTRATCQICWRVTENGLEQIDEFTSANSYVGTDGTWVINYTQWRRAEALKATSATAGPANARGRVRRVGDRLGPHPHTVESVHTSSHFSGSKQ